MKLADIIPNPKQPRKDFDEQGLKDLAENIKQVGLKQPLIVRPLPTGGGRRYQLVDGERRYRACKLIPLEDVPVDIREDIKTEEDAAIQSYIMNVQRLNYNPQDKEAYIYHLKESTRLSTRKLADKLGVHHSHVDHLLEAYRFRQKLREIAPTMVGSLEFTHSALRQTAIIKDDRVRLRFLRMIDQGRLSQNAVRETYQILQKIPPDREEVFEAYFAGMITAVHIRFLLEGPPLGRDILWGLSAKQGSHERNLARSLISDKIPSDLKHRLLHLVSEKSEKAELESEIRRIRKFLDDWLAREPDKSKHDEIRKAHRLQMYDAPEELHNFYQRYSIEVIQREYDEATNEDKEKQDIWRAIKWWLGTRYEFGDKLSLIQPPELIIPVIDFVTEARYWEVFKRSADRHEETSERETD